MGLNILIGILILLLFLLLMGIYKLRFSDAYIGMDYIKKKKNAKAVKYLKKAAASSGDPVCAYNLGLIYLQGEAVLLDKKEALKYLKIAHSNAGKGEFKVSERNKKTDIREAQNKKIKKAIKKIWREEELWRLEEDGVVINY